MAYGTAKLDVVQSSTAATAPVFKDGNGTQIGTLCRAWVNFNGTGTVAIRSSFNVSSITDNGTGDYTVNFTTALPDANYSIIGTMGGLSTNAALALFESTSTAKTTSLVRVACASISGLADSPSVSVAVFR